jgi:hypothetical protein
MRWVSAMEKVKGGELIKRCDEMKERDFLAEKVGIQFLAEGAAEQRARRIRFLAADAEERRTQRFARYVLCFVAIAAVKFLGVSRGGRRERRSRQKTAVFACSLRTLCEIIRSFSRRAPREVYSRIVIISPSIS